MTLAQFLDVSYTLLAEEYQRIDPFKDMESVRETLLPSGTDGEPTPSPVDVERQNTESLAQLQMMMKGVK